MSVAEIKPKSNKKRFILIGLGAIFGLCVLCMAIAVISSQTPTFKATQTAKAGVVAGAVSLQTEDALPTVKATKTTRPTNTISPTRTPRPTNTPAPTLTPTQVPNPVEFSGSGDQIIDFDNQFGAAFAHIIYQGERNFAVWNLDANNENIDLLVNIIGSYDGNVPIDFADGDFTKRFNVTSSGSWNITVYPLSEEYVRLCTVPGPCTGLGDDVVGLVGAEPDIAKIAHNGSSNFAVWAYGNRRELLVNEIGAYEGTILIPGGARVIVVQADGEWAMEVKGR